MYMNWTIFVFSYFSSICTTEIHKFVLQSRYYAHFQTNTLEKGMNPLILPAMG